MTDLSLSRRTALTWMAATATAMATPLGAQAADGTVLRLVPQADLKILDPVWTSATVTRDHAYMVYDTLFGMTEDGTAKPQMVDKFSHSSDGKEWTFTLRSGLMFHNDTPVTTADVIPSIKRWGARSSAGQDLMAVVKSFEVVDDKTFKIILDAPFGFMLDVLAAPIPPFIMPKTVAETSPNSQITDSTGSGPYIFKKDEYKPGSKIVYVKNTKYEPRKEAPSGTAGGKVVYVDRFEWIVLRDAQTQANALVAGEVDIIERIPPEQFAVLRANKDIGLISQVPQGSVAMFFNHLIPPFNNPKVARAAILAINQEALMRAQFVSPEVYSTNASIYPATSPLASSRTAGFTGKPQFAEAKRLLKEAGYDGKPVTMLFPTDHSTHNKYPPVMAALLRQAGFAVDLQSMDWQTLVARRARTEPVAQGGWNIFMTGFLYADTMNPIFYSPLSGKGRDGWFGWPSNVRIEALKKAYLVAMDPATRKEIATQIQEEALTAGLIGPMGEYKPMTAFRKNVSGIIKAPVNIFWGIKKA